MAKKTSKPDTAETLPDQPKATEEVKTEDSKPDTAETKEAGDHIGKEIFINQGGAEFKGLCTSERDTPSGKQVYLQLNGCVSRFFSVNDIVK